MKLLAFGLAISLVLATAPAVGAATAPTSNAQIVAAINAARVARSLVPLRSDPRLSILAGERAASMAAAGVLSHGPPGSLQAGLAERSIQWFGFAEVVAYSAGAGAGTVDHLLELWATSKSHWAMLMSDSFNYLGVGVAASGTQATYGAIVMTESRDVTGARATMVRAVVSGEDVRWTWHGADPILQRHTAGLRDFAVQRRIDRGPWMGVISSTASTSRTLSNLAGGHWYGFRVRARDRAGNVGLWSAELRVWVP